MQSQQRCFSAVLFDLYDTLIWLDVAESNRWRQRLADRLGVSLDRFLKVWRLNVNDRMLGRGGGLADHFAAILVALEIEPTSSLVSELVAIEQERLQSSVHLYPDTVHLLQQLARRGYRLGLVSNVSDGAAIPITHLGIDRLFHELVLSHEVGLIKPDPAIFRLACERLGAAPEETMFVADGGFGELDAAGQLGIFAVLVEQDSQSKDFGSSTRYDARVQGLSPVEALLEALSVSAAAPPAAAAGSDSAAGNAPGEPQS